ncbi:hypothetical protein ACFC25_10390 [Pseudarthrobacter sp. NPDC055928]|uniref:hypothetical protein n=1 Tax=Pseudarthrobacter sp. NPDC055928 TaxID=3345661 RepID=UPI0035E3ACAD
MSAYTALTQADISTREAAVIAGVPRATATRKVRTPAEDPLPAPAPANKLSTAERAHILATVNSGKALERTKTLAIARAKTPERFTTNNDPKILAIPDTAWINKPAENNDTKAAA